MAEDVKAKAVPDLAELQRQIQTLTDKVDQFRNSAQLDFPGETNALACNYSSNATPDTEDAVTHALKKVPTGFIVTKISKGGVVYNSNKPWTAEKLFLKCTVASASVELLLY